MIYYDDIIRENIKQQNPNWSQIPNYPYIISKIGGFRSGRTSVLLNLISNQSHVLKIRVQPKDPHKAKYQLLIYGGEGVEMKHYNDSKAFIEYSNKMDDIYDHLFVDGENIVEKCMKKNCKRQIKLCLEQKK